MKIQLSEEEINLDKDSTGLYYYKLNDILVEGFKTRADALSHAQLTFAKFIKEKYIKQ